MARAGSYPTDAFIVQTPQLNNLANQMYQEQHFREQMHLNESKALDTDINRELFKVKSADTGPILNDYQQYKDIKKQLYTNPKIQNDPKLFNQVQQKANAALQNIYSRINASAEDKNEIQNLVADRKAHPEKFADNFGDLIKARLNTPTDQLSNHQLGDLTNYDTYRYKGNLTNLQPVLQKAAGTMRELSTVQGVTPDKQQNTVTTYKGMNNPYDYYNNLVGGIVGSNATRDFLAAYNKMAPEQEQAIEQQYQLLKQNPNFKAAYNLPDNSDFPVTAYTTDVGKAARLMAMQHAINNVPVPNITYHNIPSARDAAILKRQQIMEGVRQGNALARIQFRHDLQQSTTQEQAQKINDLYTDFRNEALNHPRDIHTPSGVIKSYTLSATPDIKDIFAYKDDKGHSQEPDEVRIVDNKIQPIFYQKDKDTGERIKQDGYDAIDTDRSKPISEDEFKVRWQKKLLGVSTATKALNQGGKKETVTHTKGLLDNL